MKEAHGHKPSKKIYVLMIVTVFIVLLIMGIGLYKEERELDFEKENDSTIATIELDIKKYRGGSTADTDDDGLRDWEENLWGTSPIRADTDNDGTTDGEEVENYRNPLMKGPEDQLDNLKIAYINKKYQKNYEKSEEGAASARFSAALFNELSSASLETDEDISNFIDNTIESTKNSIELHSIFDSENVRVFTETDKEKLKEYGTQVSDNVTLPLIALGINDGEIKTSDMAEIYNLISQNVFEIEAPAALRKEHTDMANNFNKFYQALLFLERTDTDPVASVSAYSQIEELQKNQNFVLTTIKNYLIENDIIYDESETGFILWSL